MLKGIVRLSIAAFALVLCATLSARSIDQASALRFANSWLSSEGCPAATDGAARAAKAATPIAYEGVTYAYAVDFEPAGYMVVAGDDRLSPVIFYAPTGAFDTSEAFPLRSLVIGSAKAQLEAAESAAPENGTRADSDSEQSAYFRGNQEEWGRYLSNTRAWGTYTIEDIWVAPLTKTKWSQGSVYDYNVGQTVACFNYYTPTPTPDGPDFQAGNPNNAVCGCTATTLGQIVRYFEWPQARPTFRTTKHSVGSADNMMKKSYEVTLTTLGGDGVGGPYDWSKMVYNPGVISTDETYQPCSAENYAMIGRLLRDCGMANGMSYYHTNAGESGGSVSPRSYAFFDIKAVSSSGDRNNQVRANLDAGRPVPIDIWGAISLTSGSSGHSIYIDGYGTHNGRWFFHMNFGWGGSNDGWFNDDEFMAQSWGKFNVNAANIYRNMTLQPNEDLNGGIISGRVTDANGRPVAGVKVSIRKQGQTDTWQTMLAWYDRIDGEDCHAAVVPNGPGYGAQYYRNCTNEKGIYAIDKVGQGVYEIVLEKDGYEFLGDKVVALNVIGQDVWGRSFVAVPDSVGTLALDKWWIDGTTLRLKFNRAIGGVQLNGTQILISANNTVTMLSDCPVTYAADSDMILFDLSSLGDTTGATLTIKKGFLYYDVDGPSNSHNDIYTVPTISVAPAVSGLAQGSGTLSPAVTAISRNGNDFVKLGNELTFAVTTSRDVDINDFKIMVQRTYNGPEGKYSAVTGTQIPAASLGTLENGLLTVNVGEGYGFVRVDYIPATGDAFLGGETYLVNNAAPAIVSSEIKAEDGEQYVYLTFNKPVGGARELTSVKGTNLADDGSVYRSGNTSANGFVLFRKGPSDTPDGKFLADTDTVYWGSGIPKNATKTGDFTDIKNNGKIALHAGLTIIITLVDKDIEVAYIRWVDVNDDGAYTPGVDGFVMQLSNEIKNSNGRSLNDLYKLSGTSLTTYPCTYGSDLVTDALSITKVNYTPEGSPDTYGHLWLGPGSYPLGEHDLKTINDIPQADLQKIAYYNADGTKFPSKTEMLNGTSINEAGLQNAISFIMSWTATAGNGTWYDRSIDNSLNYVAGQDELLMGKAVADGFAGTAVDASSNLFYVDLNQDDTCTNADFLWQDNDGDGAWIKNSTTDQRLGVALPSQLNWREALKASDFRVILRRNGGTANNVRIDQITAADGTALTGATATVRGHLAILPKMSAQTLSAIPSGNETIEVLPYEGSVYDAYGNVASEYSSSGELKLSPVGGLFVSSMVAGADNGSIAIRFSKRILGNSQGGNAGNLLTIAEDERICDKEEPTLKSTITSANFEVKAVYAEMVPVMEDDGVTPKVDANGNPVMENVTAGLTLGSAKDLGILHREGSSYVVLDLLATESLRAANLPILAPAGKTLQSFEVTCKEIYDYECAALDAASAKKTIPASAAFQPGKFGLLPPVFSNKKGSYSFIHAPGWNGTDPTWHWPTQDEVLGTYNPSSTVTSADGKIDYQYQPGIFGQAPYVWTKADNNDDVTKKVFAYQRDLVDDVEGEEDGVDNGEMFFGMYYRDLDADGRIDAVDMNFFNPWGHDEAHPAELVVGPSALQNFVVWVHSDNANNEITELKDDDFGWNSFPALSDYPLDSNTKDTALYDLAKGTDKPKGWRRVTITGVSVIQQNANHGRSRNGQAQWANGNDYVYSTVRLTLDQSQVAPRTYGERQVLVSYVTPRTTKDYVDLFYDKLLLDGIDTTPLANAADGYAYTVKGKTTGADGKQTDVTYVDHKFKPVNAGHEDDTFTNADEQAGIYWIRAAGQTDAERKQSGRLNAIWVCNSFGPAAAWDGVPPQAVTAMAWRATPYPRALSTNDTLDAFEFVDVRFSEPLLSVDDLGLTQGGTNVSGYSANKDDYKGLAYGPCGATLLNASTVRFQIRRDLLVKGTKFGFWGSIYPVSGAIEHALGPGSIASEYASFAVNAAGAYPLECAYRVLGEQADTVDVIQLVNNSQGGSVTNYAPRNQYEFNGRRWHGSEGAASHTAPLTATPTDTKQTALNEHANAAAYSTRSQGSGYSTNDALIQYDATTGTIRVNAMSNSVHPGAGFYAVLNNVSVFNEDLRTLTAVDNWAKPNVGATLYVYSYKAPSASSYTVNSYTDNHTEDDTLYAGPLYVFAKARAVQKEESSRANVGEVLTVAGIDVAAPSSYKLTGVKVRLVDTSQGAFDPAVALKPLADNENSGVLLWNKTTNSYIPLSNNGLDWSEWRRTAEGLLYREVTLKPLAGVTVPKAGGVAAASGLQGRALENYLDDPANAVDFEIRVVPSDELRFGQSFYAVIPDDGITLGTYTSADTIADTWGTPNGTKGNRLTDTRYIDHSGDKRWSAGEPFFNAEDSMGQFSWRPYFDGGRQIRANRITSGDYVLNTNGINVKDIYYAKKGGALNPESSPWNGLLGIPSLGGINTSADKKSASCYDLEYNVSYEPGDDLWFDIGGTLGVYDEGIDIPIMGNADLFALPYSTQEFGARGAQFRAAATAAAGDVSTGSFAVPSRDPIPVLAVNMQDNSRGFGPRYIMGGAILVESISKALPMGGHLLSYNAARGELTFDGGTAVLAPANVGDRALLTDATGENFIVVRRMNDLFDYNRDGIAGPGAVDMPDGNTNVTITVGTETARDIRQPAAITGVRILSVGTNVQLGDSTLRRSGTTLSWNGGPAVDVAQPGSYVLYAQGNDELDYIYVQTNIIGGATSETLPVYGSNGNLITPFQKISGVEVVAVGDMIRQGWYDFSYDSGAISFGNGGAAKLPAVGNYAIVYGDGTATDYSRPYVVVRRTAAALPSGAVKEPIRINQTQLYWVDVTLRNVNGVTPTHFAALTKGADSGVSLWWDADGSGSYSAGDMPVPLRETPVFTGAGDTFGCTLIPDYDYLTAWLGTPIDGAFNTSYNFFVCVRSTDDMSFGDSFRMDASFLEPSEPEYNYFKYTNSLGVNSFHKKTRGKVAGFAEVSSKTNTCTTATNTVFLKETTPGQTIDANTVVPLTSVSHFVQTSTGVMPYVTQLSIELVGVQNFDPAQAFEPIDNDTPTALRGLVLYRDNGDGVFSPSSDTVVESTIVAEDEANGGIRYTFLLADESCTVPTTIDQKADLFVAVRTANDLPFGVSFYAAMDINAITYSTGLGSPASAVKTDILSSTINSEYADVVGVQPYTATAGLVVQKAGANVSGYQTVTLGKELNGAYTLSWNGNTVTLGDLRKPVTVTLGSGADAITVTIDLQRLFREDTLAYSQDGTPKANGALVAIGSKLTSLAGSTACHYTDVNGDGVFTLATDRIAQADSAATFVAADCLAFYDANENGVWDTDEPIFVDTDRKYTLPWMDAVLDTDSIVSQAMGAQPVALTENALDAIGAAQSPAVGDSTVAGRTYLYYIDVDGNANRNYDPLNDIVIARVGDGAAVTALTLAANDQVVLDPASDGDDTYDTAANAGATLRSFAEGDWVKMNYVEENAGIYAMTKQLLLSVDDEWQDFEMSWDFLATPERAIRRYTPNSVNAEYATTESAMSAIIGLDFANDGATDVALTSVKVSFANESGWSTTDFCALAADTTSGVQLWRDADGNGAFDPGIDTFVPLAGVPAWSQIGNTQVVMLSPNANNEIRNEKVDGIYDFFVVVVPSVTANNAQAVNDGDKFRATVAGADVVLNKTSRKAAAVTTGVITIDSKAPAVQSVVSASADGRLVDTLTLTFDEQMKRVALNDLSVWTVTDTVGGNNYAVTDFTLGDDAVTCTLTVEPAAGLTAADYSTGPVAVSANFTAGTALTDWANNPAEVKNAVATDEAAPVIVSISFLDKTIDNASGSTAGEDGHVDTLLVKFSEPVLDTTFGSSAWTLNGVALTRQDPGATLNGHVDALNDDVIALRIATPDASLDDVDNAVFAFGDEQTLTDLAGNVLVITDDFAVVDAVKLTLLTAAQYGVGLRLENNNTYTMPAGAILDLGFAKDVTANGNISGLTLTGGSQSIALTAGADFTVAFDGRHVTFTLLTDKTGFTGTADWKVVVAANNTGIVDNHGNEVGETAGVPVSIYIAPVLIHPKTGFVWYETTARRDFLIAPQIKLNSAANASSWKVAFYEADANGDPIGEPRAQASGTAANIDKIDDNIYDLNINIGNYYDSKIRAYAFVATLETAERGTETLQSTFYAVAAGDEETAAPNTLVTLTRTGDTTTHHESFDSEDQHLMLVDGAFTSLQAVLTADYTAEAAFYGHAVKPLRTVVNLIVERVDGTTETIDVSSLSNYEWSDQNDPAHAKLAVGDKVTAEVRGMITNEYTDYNGRLVSQEYPIFIAHSYTYTMTADFDDIFVSVALADGAFQPLATPITWNDPATLYALLAKNNVDGYQWRIIPGDGSTEQPWSATGDMATARTRFGWTNLDDDTILVAGGYNGNMAGLKTTELFSGVTGLWTASGDLNNPVYDNTIVSLGDGKAVSFGGTNTSGLSDAIELYENGAWTVVGHMTEAKCRVSAIRKGDKIYLFGGYASGTTYLDTIEVVTIANGQATSVRATQTLSAKRASGSAFAMSDGTIALVGGISSTAAVAGSDTIAIDATTGEVSSVTAVAGLPAVANASYAQDSKGAVWAIGGKNNTATYYYDGTAWQQAANATLSAVHESAAAICLDDKLIVVGGKNCTTTEILSLNSASADYPANVGPWTAGPVLDADRRLFALANVNESAVAFGGQTGGAYTASTDRRMASWSKWVDADATATETRITIDGLSLVPGNEYYLQIRTRDNAQPPVVSGILSTEKFAIGVNPADMPETTVTMTVDGNAYAGDLVDENATVAFAFTSVQNAVAYKCTLDGVVSVTDAASFAVPAPMTAGSHHFEVRGVSATGTVEQTAHAFDWTVRSATMVAITSDQVAANGTTVLTDGIVLKVSAPNGYTQYRYALDSTTMPTDAATPIADAIQLDGVALGSHTVTVWVNDGTSTTWADASFAFDVAAVAFDNEYEVIDNGVAMFKVNVVGSGTLTRWQWTLDGTTYLEAIPTGLFALIPFPTGAHAIEAWGVDDKGNLQPVAAIHRILNRTEEGDVRLVAALEPNATAVSTSAATVDFTVSFTDADGAAIEIFRAPQPADFAVTNGQVSAVVDNGDGTYLVQVTPDALTSGDTEMVSLQLLADKVYETTYGHGNAASAVANILVYDETAATTAKLVDFSVMITSDEAGVTPITDASVLDEFYVKVSVNTLLPVNVADVVVNYDTTKFAVAGTLVPADVVASPYNGTETAADGTQKSMAIAEALTDGQVRVGGAVLDTTQAQNGNFVLATIKFTAIGTGAAAADDFALSAGTATVALAGLKPLANDDDVIGYGSASLEVTEDIAALTIAATPTTVAEGAAFDITATLSQAIATDLTVRIASDNAAIAEQTLTITAGATTATANVTVADDNKLTGDYTATLTVAEAAPADAAVTAPAVGATAKVKVTDNAVGRIAFTIVDGNGDAITQVTEGTPFYVKATLGGNDTAAGEVRFSLAFSGTAQTGIDFTYANTFVVVAGDTQGAETVNTYADGLADGVAKTIQVDITGMAIDGKNVAAFTAPTTLSISLLDGDTYKADFTGDGVVDIDDIALFLAYYQTPDDGSEMWSACDFSGDGTVDIDDVALLLYYMQTSATRANVLANFTYTIETADDIAALQVGDEVLVKIYVDCDIAYKLASATVTFDPTALEVVAPLTADGKLDLTQAVNVDVFSNMFASGTLDAVNGSINKIGAGQLNGIIEGKQWVGQFTVRVLKAGETTINITAMNGTATGATVGNGTAAATGTGLTLTAGEDDGQPHGFQLDLHGLWQNATRAANDTLLSIGEKASAQDGYAAADGDIRAANVTSPYALYLENGADRLTRDYRAVSDQPVTWQGRYTSTDANKEMVLSWDASAIRRYDLTIAVGGNTYDMKQTTTVALSGASADFTITATPVQEKTPFTYALNAGWNLVGAPFALDEAALNAIKGADGSINTYDATADDFVWFTGTAIAAGQGFWVYRTAAANVVVQGTPDENAAGVAVSTGWNLVAPLANTAADALTLPDSLEVWIWTPNGYRWVDSDADIEVGTGYWFYSENAATIWAPAGK